MRADVTPYQAASDARDVALDHWATRGLGKIYSDVCATIGAGNSMSAALAPWIPGTEASTLATAEEASPDVFRQAFEQLASVLVRVRKVKELLYKSLLVNGLNFVVILAVIYDISATLGPEYKSLTAGMGGKLNGSFTAYFFAFAAWFEHTAPWMGLGFAAVLVAVGASLHSWPGTSRAKFDRFVWPYPTFLRMQSTIFLTTVASMLLAGTTLKTILSNLRPHASRWMRYYIDVMRHDLDTGASDVHAIATGPLPPDTADALRTYQRIPQFASVMRELADFNFEAYERAIAHVGIVLLVISTLMLLGVAGSTVVAMFGISNVAQSAVTGAP